MSAQEIFGALLEDRLNALFSEPGFCVLNFAQPGFRFQQNFAVAQREIPRYHPDLVLWGTWDLDGESYTMAGDATYLFRGYALHAGVPAMFFMPDRVNRWLFERSRLFEYLTLALATRDPQSDTEESGPEDRLSRVQALARTVGCKLAVFLPVPLDGPIQETAASPRQWQQRVLDAAHKLRIPAYSFARELAGEDYRTIGLDACCHFNAQGHRVLGEILERIVRWELDMNPPAQRPP